jgi:hypothetical protein
MRPITVAGLAGALTLFGALAATAPPAAGSETIAYTYDANGRLTKVVRTGAPNTSASGVQTQYAHDKADNRKPNVVTTGASQWSWFKWGSTVWSGQ